MLSNNNPKSVNIDEYAEQGYFAKIAMPEGLSESGVFIQGDRIVGWSFGQMAAGGYLWMGRKGNELTYDFRVEDFYWLTFGGSREEEFVLALAREDYTDSGLLAALAEAFRLESRLPAQSVPSHLRPEPIIGKMRSILTKLISEGNHRVVSEIFDSQVLINAQDPSLLADVAYIIMKSDGFENAVWLLEEVRENILLEKGTEKSRLDRLHSQLYQGWLRELMENGDITDATLALDSANGLFPEDPVLHLMGVRLALEKNDWKEAERLLFMRQYPVSLHDSVKNLENRVSKLKSLERKIVIRFSPGSKYIPVYADLNQKIRQKFIIDTGATLSTIPFRTARNLDIRIDHSNPLRIIYTAGGAKKAPEVVLSSIEIGQWVIYDFKALVLDLPHQPEMGLLGLNYLNHFRMNLNADEGILTLEPR
jgi:clan AA aspartic protease (TIGR02281 family)